MEPKQKYAKPRRSADTMHVLVRPGGRIPSGRGLAADGGPYTLSGSTTHFQVYYENSLGDAGIALAEAVLQSCENEYTQLQQWFGGITPPSLPCKVYVVTGNFGAFHETCAATEFHCAAFDGTDADLVRMLVVAEEVEVFEAAQGSGWDCGASNGEGLSRVLATELYPQSLDGFASAASWLDSQDRPDFIDNTDPTDRNYISIGCSTLFLNWLRYQLNYSWQDIIAAGAPTLAQTYANLTGANDGWEKFSSLLAQRFPIGQPSNLTTDNPFPITSRFSPGQRVGGNGAAEEGLRMGSSALVPEIVLRPANKRVERPGIAGTYHYNYYLGGSASWDVIWKLTGWSLSTSTPSVVLCQARQSDNIDHGWTDQFCIQVIETAPDFVRVRVRRFDNGTGGSGWGQNLRLDVLVIE
jgi:hypothetical protein